ncbi:hypothetical protein K501DRAFT_198636, partial [Backusella circina FSU 941]
LFEIAWQFGYGGFALYLIGISQALAESHKSISNSWLPSPRVVDAVGLTFLLAPYIVNNPLSILAGVLASTNLQAAEICTRALYFSWFFNCTCLSCSVIYCGSRLAKTLESHLKKFNTTGKRYNKVKNGVFKIRAVMILITVCCLMFACFLALYGILRNLIIKNFVGSVLLCTIWNMLGPVIIILVESAIIFNVKTDKEADGIKLKSSGEEQSSTLFETQNTIKVNGDMTFSDTLTNGALDDLKLKHDEALKSQYGQKVFNSDLKSNNYYSTGFHLDDLESENQSYDLNRQNSRAKLIDKRY